MVGHLAWGLELPKSTTQVFACPYNVTQLVGIAETRDSDWVSAIGWKRALLTLVQSDADGKRRRAPHMVPGSCFSRRGSVGPCQMTPPQCDVLVNFVEIGKRTQGGCCKGPSQVIRANFVVRCRSHLGWLVRTANSLERRTFFFFFLFKV